MAGPNVAVMSILSGQRVISEEIEKLHAGAQVGETQPRLDFPPYRSAVLRHPVRNRGTLTPKEPSCSRPSSVVRRSTRSKPI
jgi:hypothetical protein